MICEAPLVKAVEHHYNYLIQKQKLPDQKCGGHVIKARKTTTKCCCINAARQ